MTRNYLSGSIKKALLVIECVGKSTKPLKSSEVSNLTKLERATTFRILTYLTSLGYLFKDINTNLYSLGHKIFEFGDKSDFLKTLTTLCIDSIRQLSIETQHITYLAVLEGPHVVYCDKVDPQGDNAPRAFRMRLDAHSCALGKAMLAHKSYDELKEIYKSYSLHKHTSNTITSLEKLNNDFSIILNQVMPFKTKLSSFLNSYEGKMTIIRSVSNGNTQFIINLRYFYSKHDFNNIINKLYKF